MHRLTLWGFALALAAGPAPGQPTGGDVRDLPLVDVPAGAPASGSPAPGGLAAHSVAVLITGDGDWAPIDRGIAGAVAAGGVPVVGLKVRAYLERGPHGKRTPDAVARDVARIARDAMARWGRDRLVLLGYSRGADFLPFVVTRLSPDLRDRVALAALYAADQDASFEFHFLDLLVDRHRASDVPVGPELARMAAGGVQTLCVYGTDERDSPCRDGPNAPHGPGLRRIERAGAHHLDRDYAALGRLALDALVHGEPAHGEPAHGAP